jgi:hypothetical protein
MIAGTSRKLETETRMSSAPPYHRRRLRCILHGDRCYDRRDFSAGGSEE